MFICFLNKYCCNFKKYISVNHFWFTNPTKRIEIVLLWRMAKEILWNHHLTSQGFSLKPAVFGPMSVRNYEIILKKIKKKAECDIALI